MAGQLVVWMNGQLVGVWSHSRTHTPIFRYDPAWMQSAAVRALSLSLPITPGHAEIRGPVVENYFDNLLPDSQAIRARIRTRFKTKSDHAFALLEAIGRDCVGAVQLLPPGATPDGWDAIASERLTEADVAAQLRMASTALPMGQRAEQTTDFRVSIAGAQEKTALLRFGGHWHRPTGSTPTTHILKLPLGLVGNMRADMHDSVENEWLCSKILQALGFKVAKTEMATFENQKALVVERFDRRWQGIEPGAHDALGFVPGSDPRSGGAGGPQFPAGPPQGKLAPSGGSDPRSGGAWGPTHAWIARLPQEDFCQIAGKPPSQKYEADGGPSMRNCLDALASSTVAHHDRAQFALTQLAFWLLAATDGHAKNFSIFLERGGAYRLTPLYDVLSAWPVIGKGAAMIAKQDAKLAMALHSKAVHYKLQEMRVRHWKSLAMISGGEAVWQRMIDLVANVDSALAAVEPQLPAEFPPSVWHKIQSGTKAHAAQFLRELTLQKPPSQSP